MALFSGPNLGSPFGQLHSAGTDFAAMLQRGLHWVTAWSTSSQGVSAGATATVTFSSGQKDPFLMYAASKFTIRKGGLWFLSAAMGLKPSSTANDSPDITLAIRLDSGNSPTPGQTGYGPMSPTGSSFPVFGDGWVGLQTLLQLKNGQTVEWRASNAGGTLSVDLYRAHMLMIGPLAPW